MAQHVNSLTTLVAAIADGARLAIAPDYSGVALAATRALIARGVRDLHLIAVPQAGLQVDWLIGAGAVHTVEAAGINLGEFGLAPRFTHASAVRDICRLPTAVANFLIARRSVLNWSNAIPRSAPPRSSTARASKFATRPRSRRPYPRLRMNSHYCAA